MFCFSAVVDRVGILNTCCYESKCVKMMVWLMFCFSAVVDRVGILNTCCYESNCVKMMM